MGKVECPYCGGQAMLVNGSYIYPRRADLHNKQFWNCDPCKAYVGCHEKRYSHYFAKGTMPLGRLANAELRSAKSAAHALFDPMWRKGNMTRGEAYAWLADKMGLPMEECHIGMFDVDKCKQVFAIVRAKNVAR